MGRGCGEGDGSLRAHQLEGELVDESVKVQDQLLPGWKVLFCENGRQGRLQSLLSSLDLSWFYD